MKNLVTANQSHIEDAFEKINKVARFLKRNDFNEFAVVGSSALLVCGFPLNRNVGDIDVEVICSHKREQVFKALADAYGNNFYEVREEYPEVAGSTHKPYIFEIAGVKVNVWCVKEFTHSMLVEPEESASLHLCLHYVERWHTRGRRTLETHYRSHLH